MTPTAIVVWDGFRPDQMSPESTPNLWRLASAGTWLRESRSAYPPHTRVNCASLMTGSWPIRHGLPANTLYVPDLDETAPVTLANRDTVHALADVRGGELFGVPSLGQVLGDVGRSLCVVSAASRGSTTILGWGAAAVLGDGFGEPSALTERAREVCGRAPGRTHPDALNEHVTRLATEVALPELRPDVLVLWLCEPDVSHHADGVDSPAAQKAIASNDRLLGDLAGYLGVDANILVVSDHGHTPVRRTSSTTIAEIERLTGLRSGEHFVLASDGLYVRGATPVDALVAALRELPTVGTVWTRSPDTDAMSLDTVQLGGDWAPDVKFSHTWTDGYVLAGAEQRYESTHGTLSPQDMNNLFVATGPGFRRGHVSTTPCGVVDVAPTVLHLLGLSQPDDWQGRVVTEALADGADVETRTQVASDAWQDVRLATVGTTTYVMSGQVR